VTKPRLIVLQADIPFSLARKAANQTIVTNTVTKVTLDTLIREEGGSVIFQTASNDFLISEDGIYYVSYGITWAAGIINSRACHIFLNGALYAADGETIANQTVATPGTFSTILLPFVAGDVVDMRVYQGSGANLALTATGTLPIFGITKIA